MSRWGLAIAFLCAFAGCEFGGGGGGAGCLRVAQGDFTFPAKRVIKGAFEVRVTQRGFDRVTSQIKALVLAFFGADAEGRAVIPLSAFGLGSIGTGFGPFEAGLRDLVITLDISGLDVTLVPGSSPARLNIGVRDAAIGLADGVIAGSVDGFLLSGDLACALANGPGDRIALVSFDLGMSIAIDDRGRIDARVLPSSFDIKQLNVEINTDCDLPECLDGRPEGSTVECGECESICPAGNLLSAFLSALRDRFDSLFDGLLDTLGDEVANVVLGLLVNGRPLAVEGLLPVGAFLGPTLEWMRSARPLAVFVKPAAGGIRVSGAADGLGLDLIFDTGFDANTHPCIGASGPDPDFIPGPPPAFDGYAADPDGTLVAYDVAVGLSAAAVNQALFAAWKSGALCIAATSDDLARVSGGALAIGAPTLDLLLPGYASLVGTAAPIRVAVEPRFDRQPNPVSFAAGGAGDVSVAFVEAAIGVDAWLGNAWVRVFTLNADLVMGVDVTPVAGGRIELRLGALAIDNLAFGPEPLFAGARLDVVAPFVVDLALGFLAERPLSFELATGGLLGGTGVALEPTVVSVGAAGAQRDWLGIYLSLEPAQAPLAFAGTAPTAMRIAAPTVVGGRDEDGPYVEIAGLAPGAGWRARLVGGLWSPIFFGPQPYRFEHQRLLLHDSHQLILAQDGGPESEFVVSVPPYLDGEATPEVDSVRSAPAPAPLGCGGGGHSGAGLAGFLIALLYLGRRHAARIWVGVILLSSSAVGCSSKDESPQRTCEGHDQCDDGFYCADSGICAPTSSCEADGDCCPGAVCFAGWCRPTVQCGPDRACAGVDDVCEAGSCVPRSCDAATGCGRGLQCLGGRCLAGAPCDGACGAAEACDVASGRCYAADHCGQSLCGDGVRVVDWGATGADPMACAAKFACGCADVRPKDAPDLGVEPALFETLDGPRVLSYDRARRSLVATSLDGTTVAIDGSEGGPTRDQGRAVAIASPRAAADAVDLLFQDRITRGLIYGRLDPTGDRLSTRVALALGGEAGRFQCLVNAATPAGRRLIGWAFVTQASGGSVSRLVRLMARVEAPQSADDWTVTPVLETPLVRRSGKPCEGSCSLVETCVADGARERCGAVAAVPPPACAACDARSVCASFRDNDGTLADAAAACHERVEPADLGPDGLSRRGDADGPLPTGEGLFVKCAAWDDAPGGPQVIVAWHDADRGAVVVASVDAATGAELGRSRIETSPGELPGQPLDVLATGAGIILAFGEPATGALYVADATRVAGPWATRYIEQGGAFARLITDGGGAVTVMHGDPRTATLRLASRDPSGCWGKTAIAAATAVHASVLATDGGLWASWRELAFAEVGEAAHQLVLTRITAPSCAP